MTHLPSEYQSSYVGKRRAWCVAEFLILAMIEQTRWLTSKVRKAPKLGRLLGVLRLGTSSAFAAEYGGRAP